MGLFRGINSTYSFKLADEFISKPELAESITNLTKFDFIQFKNSLVIAHTRDQQNASIIIRYSHDGSHWNEETRTHCATHYSPCFTIFQGNLYLSYIVQGLSCDIKLAVLGDSYESIHVIDSFQRSTLLLSSGLCTINVRNKKLMVTYSDTNSIPQVLWTSDLKSWQDTIRKKAVAPKTPFSLQFS